MSSKIIFRDLGRLDLRDMLVSDFFSSIVDSIDFFSSQGSSFEGALCVLEI